MDADRPAAPPWTAYWSSVELLTKIEGKEEIKSFYFTQSEAGEDFFLPNSLLGLLRPPKNTMSHLLLPFTSAQTLEAANSFAAGKPWTIQHVLLPRLPVGAAQRRSEYLPPGYGFTMPQSVCIPASIFWSALPSATVVSFGHSSAELKRAFRLSAAWHLGAY